MNCKFFQKTAVVLLFVFGGYPIYAQERENTPISVNLIIDSSQALTSVISEVSDWASAFLLGRVLTEGDSLTIQSVRGREGIVHTVFSGIYRPGEKETILRLLRDIPAFGEVPDFSRALHAAGSGNENFAASHTLIISASPAGLSPTLESGGRDLLRYSRTEEFRGWRIITVGLNIHEKVARTAANWFAGN